MELHNYRDSYSDSDAYPYGKTCQNNSIFYTHGSAASNSAGTYLSNVKCVDCDRSALLFLMEPRDTWRGWFGGCGNMDCTGLENMLI